MFEGQTIRDSDMKPIRIEFVGQKDQNYDTVGDYGETESEIWFKITRFNNPNYSWAILLHELAEKRLKDQDGVTDAEVDAWDLGDGKDLDDPGLDPKACYHKYHMMADALERTFIVMSGEDWIPYEQAIEEMFP